MDIKIGADPEVFVRDHATQEFVNADDMVEGTKAIPQPVEHGAVQVDGMALEFNIDPASSVEEFKRNVQHVQQQLHGMIGHNRYELVAQPSVRFSREVMRAASKKSLMLGCEPDFNAWDEGQVNPPPNGNTRMRTGAGHIHIGWTENQDVSDVGHQEAALTVIKQLDASLGMQSLLWDNDNDRRTLYGKAGAFRIKPYGCEYRVLSNAWLRSEALVGHVYNVAKQSVEDLLEGNEYWLTHGMPPIVACINNGVSARAARGTNLLREIYGVPRWEGGHV